MSDADEQIKATIVADGNLGATISTPSQDLKANIDSQGNLVANRLSIGPDSIIDNLSNVTMSYPIKNNSFLQYDQSLNNWHNSDISIEQAIDNRKTEVYEFRRQYGYLGNTVGLGELLQNSSSVYGPYSKSARFDIPAPKGGYGKRQKLKLRIDYSYFANRDHPPMGRTQIQYQEVVQYSERNTLPIALLVDSVSPVIGGPFTGQKDFYIRGNYLEKLNTITGRISLSSNSGSNINNVTGIRFEGSNVYMSDQSGEGFTVVTATDTNNLVSAGDTIYYSNNNFIDANFVSFSTPIDRNKFLTVNPDLIASNYGSDIFEISEPGHFTSEYEVILPGTNVDRQVAVNLRQISNSINSGSFGMYLHQIYGLVENI